MTYDDMVAVHINQIGMVIGVPWHRRNWSWRWDCRGESWHEDIGMRIPQHFVFDGHVARGVWMSGLHRLIVCMPLSTASSVCMFKTDSIFKNSLTNFHTILLQHVVTQQTFRPQPPHFVHTATCIHVLCSFKVQALCHSHALSIITCRSPPRVFRYTPGMNKQMRLWGETLRRGCPRARPRCGRSRR
jgi:hypothetical protein